MVNEKENIAVNTVQAFGRIKEIFDGFPTGEDEKVSKSFRKFELEDGTAINISYKDEKEYFVNVFNDADAFKFSLSEQGLTGIYSNSVNVTVGGIFMKLNTEINIGYTRSSQSLQKSLSNQSGVLVDWLENVVNSKEYSSPPITITI